MEELKHLNIEDIVPNPYQPRLHFDTDKLAELAQSIRENGLIQPLVVRKSSVIGYELLAGERRLRACQLAGLTNVPAIVKELSDEEMMFQSIIENLQRADLNPIEEAASYQKLIEKGLTHEEIAKIMGKSRPYISNMLRLLHLTNDVQSAVKTGKISAGHARLLVPYDAQQQEEWLEYVLQHEVSVRTLEHLLANQKTKTRKKEDLFKKEEEKKLSQLLGTTVQIKSKKDDSGQLIISYSTPEEFERIINSLKNGCE